VAIIDSLIESLLLLSPELVDVLILQFKYKYSSSFSLVILRAGLAPRVLLRTGLAPRVLVFTGADCAVFDLIIVLPLFNGTGAYLGEL